MSTLRTRSLWLVSSMQRAGNADKRVPDLQLVLDGNTRSSDVPRQGYLSAAQSRRIEDRSAANPDEDRSSALASTHRARCKPFRARRQQSPVRRERRERERPYTASRIADLS